MMLRSALALILFASPVTARPVDDMSRDLITAGVEALDMPRWSRNERDVLAFRLERLRNAKSGTETWAQAARDLLHVLPLTNDAHRRLTSRLDSILSPEKP